MEINVKWEIQSNEEWLGVKIRGEIERNNRVGLVGYLKKVRGGPGLGPL